MRRIHLHGSLGEEFGAYFDLDVPTPAAAVRLLAMQLPKFKQAIRSGKFGLIRGDLDTGREIDLDEVELKFGRCREFHIIPVLSGSGGRAMAITKVVLGVALLAVGIGGAFLAAGGFAAGLGTAAFSVGGQAVTFGSIAAVGLAISATGASALLTPRPDIAAGGYDARESPDQRPSFLFGGPVNRSQQGAPIPVVYGTMRVGSQVISTGLATERI